MPLPTPAPRTPMHTRRVTYQGFRRDDGLWDIEGELHDSKPFDFEIRGEGHWAADEPIHHMRIRVTYGEDMVIRDIAVAMDAFPHGPCPSILPNMRRMVGEVLGKGWRQTIQRHLGHTDGCTHLRELLYNLATAAMQTRAGSFAPPGDGRPPAHLGQCVSWDFDGPVVEKVYPMFFRWRAQPVPAKGS
ncbi:DUF2889 domain-containing protein [Hydrogenophaga sp. YM1]|uniref:DUF2889 domain-containing protein n=1 Tax=Hydrogenophaga TaxID=47420 RepID=UPI00086ECE09|nr:MULTISPECIES: DUF2889 domain-containing protein [unclassified Hydrogenophaga]MBN9372531.1 DUF2889 domain-containing protein [Hydrogenophaga sp.]ODT31662.1 MAG: hypothetical protein ABS53_09960 [Hydrogenophaga sp. SCN 70-13]OJV57320.1 MAG: hypothetical protein BGO22_04050 [Hydrogenophaga sp. 70-12]QRR35745.1 DUF2889 domain-containing protein [Hydrogenophaga sp. YM1]